MKKFTTIPIGLGFSHVEHEQAAAFIWNDLADKELPPDSLWTPLPVRLSNISYRLERGSMLDLGVVVRVGDQYRLSDWAIEKINAFLSNH